MPATSLQQYRLAASSAGRVLAGSQESPLSGRGEAPLAAHGNRPYRARCRKRHHGLVNGSPVLTPARTSSFALAIAFAVAGCTAHPSTGSVRGCLSGFDVITSEGGQAPVTARPSRPLLAKVGDTVELRSPKACSWHATGTPEAKAVLTPGERFGSTWRVSHAGNETVNVTHAMCDGVRTRVICHGGVEWIGAVRVRAY
jgi:hypothetical protein